MTLFGYDTNTGLFLMSTNQKVCEGCCGGGETVPCSCGTDTGCWSVGDTARPRWVTVTFEDVSPLTSWPDFPDYNGEYTLELLTDHGSSFGCVWRADVQISLDYWLRITFRFLHFADYEWDEDLEEFVFQEYNYWSLSAAFYTSAPPNEYKGTAFGVPTDTTHVGDSCPSAGSGSCGLVWTGVAEEYPGGTVSWVIN